MSDNVALPGTGANIATDEVTDATLGKVQVQFVKLMDGTLDGTSKAAVGANGLKVDPSGVTSPVSLASVPSHAVTNAGTFAVQGTQILTVAANGLTSSRVNAAASTNATSLKASAGQVGEIDVFNAAAYTVFLKLYNKASAPTVGTDTPIWTIPIAAGGGFSKSFPRGKSFATGIAYAITKLQADSDTTVVVAGDLTGSIDWI